MGGYKKGLQGAQSLKQSDDTRAGPQCLFIYSTVSVHSMYTVQYIKYTYSSKSAHGHL